MTRRTMTVDCTPTLPANWRERVARERAAGIPDSPKHRFAYRNFVVQCFPHADMSDPEAREQVEAWWVLMQLPYDGVWQYWLTAPEGGE